MKILVTGGTGFIGSHLLENLVQSGNDVTSVAKDNLNEAFLKSLNITMHLGDLNNGIGWERILSGVDIIYHLAGVTRASNCRQYYEGNYLATKRFVAMCSRFSDKIKRFVLVSSLAAVGPSPDNKPVREDAPYRPVSHYGKSKMLAEQEVLLYRDKLPITIIRPSVVYGQRDRDMFKYINMIRKGFNPMIGSGKKILNLIHVQDLVRGIMQAGTHPEAEDQIFFLGGDKQHSSYELAETVGKILNQRYLSIPIPHPMVYLAGALSSLMAKSSGRPVIFNYQKAKEAVQKSWACSIEKINNRIGFYPELSLHDGMKKTCQWYEDQGWFRAKK